MKVVGFLFFVLLLILSFIIINQLHISNLIFTDKKFNFKIQKKKIIRREGMGRASPGQHN